MSSPPSTISRFAGNTPNNSSNHHHHHHNGGSLALVKRLKLLASDVDNQPVVCRRGILPSLLLFLQNTDPEVRHTAAETLVLLSSHSENPECLCRERGLVQIVVSSFRSSKDSDPVFYELCGTIIKNLGSAVHSNNQNVDVMLSPSSNPNNKNRSASTFTQLEFLSGSRSRNDNSNNQNGVHSPFPNRRDNDDDDDQNDQQRTPSPNINGNNNNNINTSANDLLQNSATASMTTTRRYNPRTRQSHFINGGMPSTATCRNVQLRLRELVPSKRQQLVECLHTTRGVISYTIDLPTRNLTVFLSVPAQNLVTTLGEDGFAHVEVLADVEVQMSNEHNERRQEYNNNHSNQQNQQQYGGINLNDYYNNNNSNSNSNEGGENDGRDDENRIHRRQQQQAQQQQQLEELSEYKKSLMIGEMNQRGKGSLISRIQERKKLEQEQSTWSTVWETLKNVFW